MDPVIESKKTPVAGENLEFTRSYKGRFPFRIAAPSFIYADTYHANARRLGHCLDEMELLVFESRPQSLPSPREIEELAECGRRLALTYDVHLPLDLPLGSGDETLRRAAVRGLLTAMARVAPLGATTHTLHLNAESGIEDRNRRRRWLESLEASLSELAEAGIHPGEFSIETLMYPFTWLDPLLDRFDLAVCLDMGHLMLSGQDLAGTFRKYSCKTCMIHIHGVDNTHDHLSLDRMEETRLHAMLDLLDAYYGTVSVEVFAPAPLKSSLAVLERRWPRNVPGNP